LHGPAIHRTSAVPIRAALEVSSDADGDPSMRSSAATAQGTLAGRGVEVTVETTSSGRVPPSEAPGIHAGTEAPLVGLIDRAGLVPAGPSPAYEHEREDRWLLVAARSDERLRKSRRVR